MVDIYKARWENAVRIAERVNQYVEQGYFIMTDDELQVTEKFRIADTEIKLPIGDKCTWLCFENDKETDHGLYTKISDFNAQFKKWKIVAPENVVNLIEN